MRSGLRAARAARPGGRGRPVNAAQASGGQGAFTSPRCSPGFAPPVLESAVRPFGADKVRFRSCVPVRLSVSPSGSTAASSLKLLCPREECQRSPGSARLGSGGLGSEGRRRRSELKFYNSEEKITSSSPSVRAWRLT